MGGGTRIPLSNLSGDAIVPPVIINESLTLAPIVQCISTTNLTAVVVMVVVKKMKMVMMAMVVMKMK